MANSASQLQKELEEQLENKLPKLFPHHKYVTYKDVKIVEEYRKENPVMNPREFDILLQDVKTNGFYDPITLNRRGELLDGFHRLKISKILGGVLLPVQVMHFATKKAELRYVKTVNLMRRQVKNSVRIQKMAELYPEVFVKTKSKRKNSLDNLPAELKTVPEHQLRNMVSKYRLAQQLALQEGRLEVTEGDIERAVNGKAIHFAKPTKQSSENNAMVVRSVSAIARTINRAGKRQISYEHVVKLQPVAQRLLIECNKRIAAGK